MKIVPHRIGELTHEILKSRGYSAEFKTYNGLDHQTSKEEVKDVMSFLQQVIPDQTSK